MRAMAAAACVAAVLSGTAVVFCAAAGSLWPCFLTTVVLLPVGRLLLRGAPGHMLSFTGVSAMPARL
eukprot:366010-Chlamydomonas_euryale.AAC.5